MSLGRLFIMDRPLAIGRRGKNSFRCHRWPGRGTTWAVEEQNPAEYQKSPVEIPVSALWKALIRAWAQQMTHKLLKTRGWNCPSGTKPLKFSVVGQFAVAAVSDRRKLLKNIARRSETAATAAKMYHYQIF